MPPVLLERDGAVAVLRLHRPAHANAVDAAVIDGLEASLDAIERDHAGEACRAVVLTGSGATFCAGGDLDYFATLRTRRAGMAMSRRMTALLDRLAGSDRVSIAAVNGPAIGGGAEMMLACHLRLASSKASVSFRHRDLGMSPGWGGGVRLLEAAGPGRALGLLLTAATLDAGAALDLGLVHAVVEPAHLLPAALDLARDIASRPAGSIRGFLELAAAYRRDGREAARRFEAELFGKRWGSNDFRRLMTPRRRTLPRGVESG